MARTRGTLTRREEQAISAALNRADAERRERERYAKALTADEQAFLAETRQTLAETVADWHLAPNAPQAARLLSRTGDHRAGTLGRVWRREDQVNGWVFLPYGSGCGLTVAAHQFEVTVR